MNVEIGSFVAFASLTATCSDGCRSPLRMRVMKGRETPTSAARSASERFFSAIH